MGMQESRNTGRDGRQHSCQPSDRRGKTENRAREREERQEGREENKWRSDKHFFHPLQHNTERPYKRVHPRRQDELRIFGGAGFRATVVVSGLRVRPRMLIGERCAFGSCPALLRDRFVDHKRKAYGHARELNHEGTAPSKFEIAQLAERMLDLEQVAEFCV
jgi:hypothetical protein